MLFDQAIARFDAANAQDPNEEFFDGARYPRELLYAQRLSAFVKQFYPEASEALQLAARCQHIQRWQIPRSEYPPDRQGYHRWRRALAQFHADTAGNILREVGYDEELIARVQVLLRKENLQEDPEVQNLEDVICLVFLAYYFAEFASRHEAEKLLGILRKTWRKMSPRAQEAALALDLPSATRALVAQALT